MGGRDITSSVSFIMKAVIGNNLVTRISMTGRSNSTGGDLLKFGDTNVAFTIIGRPNVVNFFVPFDSKIELSFRFFFLQKL